MTCLEIKELLSAFIDNEIDDDKRNKVERHLEKCASCRKDLEELQNIIAEFSSFEDVPIPAEFDDRLHEALATEGQNIRNAKVILADNKNRINWKRISSVAAVFLVGLFSVILYNNNLEEFDKQESNDLNCVLYDTTEQFKDSGTNGIILDEINENENNSNNSIASDKIVAQPKEETSDSSIVEEPTKGVRSIPNQENVTKNQPSMVLKAVEENQTPTSSNIQNNDEELNSYIDELDKLLIDSIYIVNYCTKNDEENMWLIGITITKINSEGEDIKENVEYYGQDGKLWKKE